MAWRPLLRIARRDALRARGRSLLIITMVMLPLAGVGFIDVMLRTASIDSHERLGIELGRTADARVISQGGGPVLQQPDTTYASGSASGSPTGGGDQPVVDPTTLFPAGSRWITDDRDQVTARTTDGLTVANFRELDYTDPLAQGTVHQTSGRVPRSTAEVVTTGPLLATLGLHVGDMVALTRPAVSLRIVGTYRSLSADNGTRTFLGLPGTALAQLRALPGGTTVQRPQYLLDTSAPVTWPQVLAFNSHGIVAYSRYVVEHPPARSQVPYYAGGNNGSTTRFNFATVAALALVVGLAVLEVSLLAGAAFAVGARRQRRALGLLAATGGTARHVRTVVLGQGLVLGAAGGVAGVTVGIGAWYAAIPIVNNVTTRVLPSADLRPAELSALVALGVLTGLAAAVLPARAAARQDVVAALRGRTGITHTRRRLPAIGLGLTAVGAALALGGGALALSLNTSAAPVQGSRYVVAVLAILAGAVLTQLGLIAATPAIVGAVGRLGRWLPLAPRLALRDASRHRARSAPAVAAILTAVAGSVALKLFVSALSDKDRREYHPQAGYGQFVLNAYQPPAGSGQPLNDAPAKLAAIRRAAPPDDVYPVRTLSTSCDAGAPSCRSVASGVPPANMCPYERIQRLAGRPPTASEYHAGAGDPRCTFDESNTISSGFSSPVVGDYAGFVRLTGVRSAAAERALTAGGMVVFRSAQVLAGHGFLDVSDYAVNGDPAQGPPAPTQVAVPAAYVDVGNGRFLDSYISPQAATKVGVRPVEQAVVVQYRTPPDDNAEERVRAELAKLGTGDSYFSVERGYRDRYGIGLLALLLASAAITLGAAGIATGLAQADARADHATLAAVGSPPRVRRSLAAWQAVVVAGLGALLGTASGFVPMTAYLYAEPAFHLIVPWRNLAVIALVVPAVAAAGAWLLTRSRLPLDRRIEA